MTSLYSFIIQSVSEISGIPREDISGDSHFQEILEMDSLEAVEVLHLIEVKYRIKFQDIDLEGLQTVNKIHDAAVKRIDEKTNSTN